MRIDDGGAKMAKESEKKIYMGGGRSYKGVGLVYKVRGLMTRGA